MRVRHGSLSQADVKLIKSLQKSKYRHLHGLFVAEGEKLIGEMLPSYRCRLLAGSEPLVRPLAQMHAPAIAEALMLTDPAQILRVSGQKSPRPLIALFETPPPPQPKPDGVTTLVLDDIQDPGNLGNLLRTCDWFGIRQVLCTPGCADIYSPKVLQATMGALARVSVIRYESRTDLTDFVRGAAIPVIGTFVGGKPLEALSIPEDAAYMLLLGNEGNGIGADLSVCASERVTIPSPASEHCESLNVAAAGAIAIACLSARRSMPRPEAE